MNESEAKWVERVGAECRDVLAELNAPAIPRFLLRNAPEYVSEFGTRIFVNLKFGRERKADGMTADLKRHDQRYGTGCRPAWD